MGGLPGGATIEGIRARDDFADTVLHAVGHDVHATDALDFSDLLDEVNAEIDPLLLLILGATEPSYDCIRDMHTCHILADPVRGFG